MFELLPMKEIIEAETKLERLTIDLLNKYMLEEGMRLQDSISKIETLTNTKINLGASGKSLQKRKLLFQTRVFSKDESNFPYCFWATLHRSQHDSFYRNIIDNKWVIIKEKERKWQNMN